MLDATILALLTNVDELKQRHDADGVKVYFKSIDNYTIKVIKDEKVIHVCRKGHKQFDKLL